MKIHNVEQNTEEWHLIRLGKPTGSVAGSLITPTGKPAAAMEKYAAQLANDLYLKKLQESWGGNYHTERGHRLEPAAASMYALVYGRDVQRVGFVTDDDEQYGVSPDRFVDNDGMLEIKCLSRDKHTAAFVYYKEKGKAPPDYYSQVQMQLLVTGRKWCDLFYYHPELPDCIIRIKPDEEYQKTLKSQLTKVLKKRDEIYEMLKAA